MNGVMGMSRIEELEKQITELDERKVALQHELELEKQKTEIEYPFQKGDDDYFLKTDGSIYDELWNNITYDKNCYMQGNVFHSEAEAIKERDRRALLTRFRHFRDKCNGDWKPEWRKAYDNSYCYNIALTYDDGKASFKTDWNRCFDSFCLFGYFKNESDAERAIELFGDEIIRLWVDE